MTREASSTLGPVFKEPFCPGKYRDAECRVFTRVRAPLRENPGREGKRGKLGK